MFTANTDCMLDMVFMVVRTVVPIPVYGVPKRRCDTATQFAVAVGEYYLRVVAAFAFASGKSQRTRECCKTLKALAVNQYGLYFF